MTASFTIPVTAEHEYPVIIGRGLLGELPHLCAGAQRVAIIHSAVLSTSAEAIRDDLHDGGFECFLIEVPAGEDAKTAPVASFAWETLGTCVSSIRRHRRIGWRATTDLAGFVAATWLRGVKVIQIPTMLAMVDAAVGGKTGINSDAGKNLIGSFHSPHGVLCDMNALESLPPHDLLSGFAEVIKVGFTHDASILTDIEERGEACVDPGGDLLADLVRRAVQVKADVVAVDFKETGEGGGVGRAALNYGHTFGHAIERVESYRWRHGAAISVGMVYVAELARLEESSPNRRPAPPSSTRRQLADDVRRGSRDQLLSAIRVDKKARGSVLRSSS